MKKNSNQFYENDWVLMHNNWRKQSPIFQTGWTITTCIVVKKYCNLFKPVWIKMDIVSSMPNEEVFGPHFHTKIYTRAINGLLQV